MKIKYNHRLVILLVIPIFIAIVPAQQIRVACIGNSITAGAWLPNPAEDSYPAVLGVLLGPDYHVRNFGYSGSTVLKNSDSPYWEKSSYQFALGFFPDIVVILLGTNDSKPENWIFSNEFESDYIALIESFIIKNADATFILCYPPPILFDTDSEANLKNEVIPKISAVGNQTGSSVLNLYGSFENRSELYQDGIHPNEDGYQLLANLVYKRIQKLSDVIAPEVPMDFIAEGADLSVILSWSPNSEPDLGSYVLFRAESVNNVLQYLTNVVWPQVNYTDYNVVGGNPYYYSIAAMDLSGNMSVRSAVKSAIPLDTAPDTPTNFVVVSGDGHVNLSWDPSSEPDLATYILFRAEFDETMINYSTNVHMSNTTYIDNNLINGNSYYYSIAAMDKGGNMSERSAVKLGEPKDNTKPEAPTNLGVLTEFGQVVLHWDHNSEPDLKEYDIYRSINTFNSKDEAGTIGVVLKTETSFIDTDLDVYTEYFYSVTATDSSGNESDLANVVTTVTLDVENRSEEKSNSTSFIVAPNPFNSVTALFYNISKQTHVRLSVVDILGKEVCLLVDRTQKPGRYTVIWNAKDGRGNQVSAGVYLYNFTAEQKVNFGKMVYLK
ncbi:MAG: GDSL-type esterase/lipase family protein [Candidatus Neomarinimicrobiota bacterium]